MNRLSGRSKKLTIRLLAIVNLCMAAFGMVGLSALYPVANLLTDPLGHKRISLILLYTIWGANFAMLILLLIGTYLILRQTLAGVRICSWTYVFTMAWWSLSFLFVNYIFYITKTENVSLIADITACIAYGNIGIAPQQATFFPVISLGILFFIFRAKALSGPLTDAGGAWTGR
jgi:hypothetical protein